MRSAIAAPRGLEGSCRSSRAWRFANENPSLPVGHQDAGVDPVEDRVLEVLSLCDHVAEPGPAPTGAGQPPREPEGRARPSELDDRAHAPPQGGPEVGRDEQRVVGADGVERGVVDERIGREEQRAGASSASAPGDDGVERDVPQVDDHRRRRRGHLRQVGRRDALDVEVGEQAAAELRERSDHDDRDRAGSDRRRRRGLLVHPDAFPASANAVGARARAAAIEAEAESEAALPNERVTSATAAAKRAPGSVDGGARLTSPT